MTPDNGPGTRTLRVDVGRVVLYSLVTLAVLGLLLFLPAGTLAWTKGWLLLLVFVVTGLAGALAVGRVNPEIFAARSRIHEGTKGWDLVLLSLLMPAMLAIFPVAALDDARFHWSRAPWWVCGVGYVLFLAGMGIALWAEAVNKFFEPGVRIQTDRDHRVIDTGPYAIVRHPGYVSASLLVVGMALALGSWWALIPAGLTVLLLVIRTRWEDRTLQAELDGYKEYAQRVRSKWIPGVW